MMKKIFAHFFLASTLLFTPLFFSCNKAEKEGEKQEESYEEEESSSAPKAGKTIVFEELKPADFEIQMMQIGTSKKVEQRKIVILDVRTANEFTTSHLVDAVNIDVNAADFATQVKAKLDPEVPVFVYCKSGTRSKTAGEQLKAMNYKAIFMLEGGIEAWSKAGKEVVFAM